MALSLLAGSPGFLHAAEHNGYVIRSDVREVRLVFAASDAQGNAVGGLSPSDIAVADNGVIVRRFRSFQAASESPLDLVILLDASDSISTQLSIEIAELNQLLRSTKWGERDRVSVVAFGGSRPTVLCAYRCQRFSMQAELGAVRADGATPLYDALLLAIELLQHDRNPDARPAILLFSDGRDTSSIHSGSEALAAAQELQSSIYCVNSRSAKWSSNRDGDAVLRYLAAETGGLSFGPGTEVQSALHSVLEDLRGGYILTYEVPRQTAGVHEVRILATGDPKLRFRSRRAYNNPEEK
jgi:VWFA-related protein